MEDKWYHDVKGGELINLRDCKGVWVYKDSEETEEHLEAHILEFAYYGKSDAAYLHYESSKLMQNAFIHYTNLLGCVEIDVSSEPVTL